MKKKQDIINRIDLLKNKDYLTKQENEELKVKLSGKTFYCWSCEKLTRENEKLKQALQEIIDYCSRVEQGSVIASQDCLMNSIKNVANYSLKEVSDVKY